MLSRDTTRGRSDRNYRAQHPSTRFAFRAAGSRRGISAYQSHPRSKSRWQRACKQAASGHLLRHRERDRQHVKRDGRGDYAGRFEHWRRTGRWQVKCGRLSARVLAVGTQTNYRRPASLEVTPTTRVRRANPRSQRSARPQQFAPRGNPQGHSIIQELGPGPGREAGIPRPIRSGWPANQIGLGPRLVAWPLPLPVIAT